MTPRRRASDSFAALTRSLGAAGWFPVVALMGVAAVERFDDAAFGVLGPEIKHAFHLSDARYILIATLTSVLPLLLAVPTGYLGDRGNRVRLSRVGALVWGATAIATGLAPAVWILVIARLAGGAGLLVNEPTHASLLADYYPPTGLGSAFGIYRLGSTGLGLVGAPLAGVMAGLIDWRATFVLLALPTVAMVVVMGRLREPERGASVGVTAADEELPSMGEGYRRVRAIRSLRRTWVAAFLFGGATVPFNNYLNLYLDEVFHFSSTARGVVTGVFGVGTLVGLAVGGLITQRLMATQRTQALPVVMAVMVFELAGGIVLMALAPTAGLAVAAIVVLSIGASGFLPAYQTLVTVVSPPRLRGQAFAWSLLWYGLGAIVIGTLVGAVAGAHGQRVALVMLAVIVAVAAAVELTSAPFVTRDAEEAVALEQAATSAALLACAGLDVAYDGCQVLFGVDLEIHEGEMVALLGTNGAGKSTLLRAISGLVDPVGGAIFFAGRDVTHADARVAARLGIAHVPGGRGVFPTLTVAENLRVAGWLPGDDRVADVRAEFPVLAERWNEAAGDLSGGEQQMLCLAAAMLSRPKLLLVDELSLGLAPKVVEQLLGVVRAIHAAGTTVIIIEQSVTTALQLATRAVFMEKGEVRFDGPAAELLDRRDLLRSVFLGRTTSRAGRRRRVVTEDTPVVLEARGVSKRYGGVSALTDVDLVLHEGEILGIIGPNGAGKTTLFDIASGFAQPDGGQVFLSGADVTNLSPAARARLGLGRSFQDARLFPSLTVRETLAVACERVNDGRAMAAAAFHLPVVADAERSIADRVENVITTLGLAAFANKFVGELSTGSRRIVDLGAILCLEPAVVILDEPSSGISQKETEALAPLLQSVQQRLGASLLVIEHDMGLIASLADQLVALDRGEVIALGRPSEVLRHPLVVESYLGQARPRSKTKRPPVAGRAKAGK